MAKVKFSLEAGIMIRNGMRNILNKLKTDVMYQCPGGYIEVVESKGLLLSHFTFIATDVSDVVAMGVNNAYKKIVRAYS